MKKQELLNSLEKIPNGRIFNITWKKELPTYKGIDKTVIKTVDTTARKGIDYTHTGYYKSRVLDSNPNNPKPEKIKKTELLWGHWVERNLLIGYTNKAGEYKEYLRLYITGNRPKVIYTMDGIEVDKKDLKGIVTAAGLKHTGIEICYNIPIDNIVKIGK